LLGGGVFESVRLTDCGIRAGRRHLARLQASTRALGLPVPEEAAFAAAIAAAEGEGEVVRLTLHDDEGRPVLDGRRRAAAAVPAAVSLVSLPGWYARGYRLREHKLTSHFHGVRGRAVAGARGADDGLLVEEGSGLVGEATNANVIALVGGTAVTPPIDGLLPGITRAICLELLPELGVPVEEAPLELGELQDANGVLLMSTLGVVPASTLDGVELEQPALELVRALRHALDLAETATSLPLPLR
jgi:branched-subunit amino acid aminotransferase/4-amino-4-deoxychorismate lyase